jgi:hypothetical protein
MLPKTAIAMPGDAQLKFSPHNALDPIPGRHPKGVAGQSPLPITNHPPMLLRFPEFPASITNG